MAIALPDSGRTVAAPRRSVNAAALPPRGAAHKLLA